MNHDDLLDRAIDEVARELTDAAPRRGFSERVRERLETPPRSRSWAWQAMAAAAALALVAYLVWPASDRRPNVQVAHAPAATPGSERQGPAPEVGPALPLPHPPHTLARGATHPARVLHSQPKPRMRIAIDPEAPQLDAIPEPANLSVKPLEIAELTIVPLEPEKESR
jgi:hypothetical protein